MSKDKEEVNSLKPILLQELMNRKFPPIKWIVEPLIPFASITALSGSPASYKTFLILEIAIAIAEGKELFGHYLTTQTAVLIIDEETGLRTLQDRMQLLTEQTDLPIYFESRNDFKLTPNTVESIIDFAKQNNVGLVIFDSLIRISTAQDENDSIQMAKVTALFQKLSAVGLTVIFTHHNRKQTEGITSNASSMRGSSDILAGVDCHITVDRKGYEIRLIQTKLRQAEEVKPFTLKLTHEDNRLSFEYKGVVKIEPNKFEHAKESIQDMLSKTQEKLNKTQLHTLLEKSGEKIALSTYKNALNTLIEESIVQEEQGGKNAVYVSLVSTEEEQVI